MDAVQEQQRKQEMAPHLTFVGCFPQLSPFVSQNQLFHLWIKKMVLKLQKNPFDLRQSEEEKKNLAKERVQLK